ncbi:methyl-accepting chemotaxis protein [Novosphingobium piscinae]|uniref:Methyl-accepting chemotaxis protein n=1 Tax=Novosphingobium piscinae TaxID=1507448 RepID=A0A7X1G174_9SPHN|nr:methyl-accepting chemotaxis protein [Novosphingobium piscinae]MBC2670731.1 methyl-accepting chemotaxis protein [Novosphingobium piscinae]
MLTWFRETAPIRLKFRVLAYVQATMALLVTLTCLLLAQGLVESPWVSLPVALLSAAEVALIVFAGKLISDPYVTTVERMEALAAGNLDGPVEYTHYQDCVGRLTRAMATFRAQAVALRDSQSQQTVVHAMTECLQRLADNDLTVRMHHDLPPGYEELRENFNRAAEALGHALNEVAVEASGILNGSNEIRAASDDLSRRTEQQAASLEESSAGLNQVTGSVQQNATEAQSAAQSVREAQEEAREGGGVVSRAVAAMNAIQSSADEIAKIIAVIDSIAFQTNLLALNAGVEAARAGESGKGFAVVANEVRALAQRSAEAATQIRTLISASTQQVTEGVALVGATGEALTTIVDRIDRISGAVAAIADSAVRQSAALGQVNAAARDMDRMTQQNAAMVEQTNAAARELADRSGQLARLVSRFRIEGSAAGSAASWQTPARAVAQPAPTAARRPAAAIPLPSASRPAPTPVPAAAPRRQAVNAPLPALAEADDWSSF